MKAEFISPKFTGERFDKHSLPIDVARDLAAYQSLIIELAKALYFKDHPERQRTPRGFGSAFELHLSKVEEGSAIVPLMAVTVALSAEPNAQQYFDQARELVTQCVAAPPDALPEDFPKEFLSFFNQVGSSLLEGETMELPSKSGVAGILTPSKRKRLVLAQSAVYERKVELTGYINEIDWDKNSIRLRLTDGGQVTVTMPDHFELSARLYGGTSRHLVILKGTASYDAFEQLRSVDRIESIRLQLNHEIAGKLERISSLQDGWYDGKGKAPDPGGFAEITRMLVWLYPSHIPLPVIVPTPEGNLLLEWSGGGEPSLDIDVASKIAEFHRFTPDGGDEEATFVLSSEREWRDMMTYLSKHIQRNS
jgi:hypothetical protein